MGKKGLGNRCETRFDPELKNFIKILNLNIYYSVRKTHWRQKKYLNTEKKYASIWSLRELKLIVIDDKKFREH